MKIAFVYDRVYPFHIGGGEKRAWELARTLASRGHEISILTLQMWDGPRTIIRENVHLVGVSQNKVSGRSKRSPGDILRFALGLGQHLLQNSYDIVECANFPYLSCLVARYAQLFNPFILVICWFEVRGWKGWWKHRGLLGLLAAAIERMVPLVIRHHCAISKRTQERMGQFLQMPSSQVKIVECGANIQFVSQFISNSKKPQLVTAGRLVLHKRVDRAILILDKLRDSEPDLHLKIIGQGPEEENLRALSHQLNLESRITFAHGLSEEELYQTYAESMIFLFPSEMEGFGIVAIEAMAAGTPVIIQKSPHSAACELITDQEDGLLAETPEDWVRNVKRLLRDEEFYRSVRQAGLSTAAAYDWTKLTDQTENYFNGLCQHLKRPL